MKMRKVINPIVALVLFALFGTASARAQDAIRVTLTPERGELTVGDVVPLTLRITHPAGYRVVDMEMDTAPSTAPPSAPDTAAAASLVAQQWGDFEIRSQTALEVTQNADGTETTTGVIEVTLWAPGTFRTPALPISVVDTAGRVFNVLADPVALTVNSVLVDGDTELRDIKPQALLPPPPLWLRIGGWALAVVAVTVVLWLLARWLYTLWRRRIGRAPRPAHQTALDELARIERLDLPAQNGFGEHYALISHALRRYLEEAYRLPALDRTTAEISATLRTAPIATAHQQAIINLLVDADLVKFANLTPGSSLAAATLQDARQLVRALTPQSDATATSRKSKRRTKGATA